MNIHFNHFTPSPAEFATTVLIFIDYCVTMHLYAEWIAVLFLSSWLIQLTLSSNEEASHDLLLMTCQLCYSSDPVYSGLDVTDKVKVWLLLIFHLK